MIIDGAQILTLSVESDAGAIVGCGLLFQDDLEARSFADAACRYYESELEKTSSFKVTDRRNDCDITIELILEDSYTGIDFKSADHRVLEDLTAALETQPYIFIIVCRREAGEIVPYLTDTIVMYRSEIAVDGRTVSGKRRGKWPSEAQLDFGE